MTRAEETQREAHGIAYGSLLWYGTEVTKLHSWWCVNVLKRSELGSCNDDIKELANMSKEEFEGLYARWVIEKGDER